jgi:DNA-binding SARP family transcriptional activator
VVRRLVAGRVEFRILGPLEVRVGGREVALGGPRQRALLAILLTRANEVVSSDRLIDELWGEEPPSSATNVLQTYVYRLRKAVGQDVLETRPPGYVVRVEPGQLDLHRFEALVEQAGRDLAAGGAAGAAEALREALALWRGPALADFTYEPFAQAEAARLEELRLGALERRIEADLAVGRHAEVVGELDALVSKYPLRERLRGQLMLALYRSGRQAEALDAYQAARRTLVEELGIEPGQALQELERAILRQDPVLEPVRPTPGPAGEAVAAPAPELAAPERAILVAARDGTGIDALLALAEPLARRPVRELILTVLTGSPAELDEAIRLLHERRVALLGRGASARATAFVSSEPGSDAVRLASQQSVDLLLFDATEELAGGRGQARDVMVLLAGAPCDVALLVAAHGEMPALGPDRPVVVPFGGAAHEWAAAEIGAWLAVAVGAPLKLAGTAADEETGQRDASRLLATASLVVQTVAGIEADPVLVPPGAGGMAAAAEGAGLLVVGLSDRWQREGVGGARLGLAGRAAPPILFVRGGLRPGGLAPSATLTRFTWTLAEGAP